MMKRLLSLLAASALLLSPCGCGGSASRPWPDQAARADAAQAKGETIVTKDTTVGEVAAAPALGDFGRLLFPVDRDVPDNMTLAEVSSSGVYVWYSHIQPDKTVDIVNDVIGRAERGEQVFYPIYTEAEMEADPSKLVHRNSFNIASMSFDPEIIYKKICEYVPGFKMEYDLDPLRQQIADSWPNSLDDSCARREWGWMPEFDLDGMTRDMLVNLREKLHIPAPVLEEA